ncbi:MAG: glycoside hydrolase family 1 protein [candidate division WWE3 bacterium]|nr:glycoside hydrolase family 1 protein [candidate division WWE3 bacterium]
MKNNFPQDFLWGAATSSHQVEGGNVNNDWYQAEQQGRIPKAGLACDSYHRFEGDFDLAASLGHNCHRLSLEWSRLEPTEGHFDQAEFDHYKIVLQSLRRHHLKSFVTLWHFTTPIWFTLSLSKGWENKRSVEYFRRYAEKCAREFGDLVDFWAPFNETTIYGFEGYLEGKWPPFKKGNYLSCLRFIWTQIKAHKAVYEAIKKLLPEAKVGPAINFCSFEPYRPGNLLDCAATWLNSTLYNKVMMIATKNYSDYIGCNYYFHKHVMFKLRASKLFLADNIPNSLWVNDLGWEIYPRGIYEVLTDLKSYGKPIYITENGLADSHDVSRRRLIEETLTWVQQAMSEGANVRGYIQWALIDNYEWSEGFGPRFGLIAVDYEHDLKRTVRPSALWFRDKILSFRA